MVKKAVLKFQGRTQLVYTLAPGVERPCQISKALWNAAATGHADITIMEVPNEDMHSLRQEDPRH